MITIYFSGTGNSKYIAEQFSSRMKISCYSIEEKINFTQLIEQNDAIAFCYPIYGSCLPRMMRDFIQHQQELLRKKKILIFCTQMMFSGDGAKALTHLLKNCDENVLYAEHFNMPNNISNVWFLPITDWERKRKRRKADRKLDRVCADIQKGVVRKRGWSAFSQKLGLMQGASWPAVEEKKKGSFHASEACIGCGMCVKLCPVKNLEMQGKTVAQHNRCMLCFRCVNICPHKAISVLGTAKPKRQYKGPVEILRERKKA